MHTNTSRQKQASGVSNMAKEMPRWLVACGHTRNEWANDWPCRQTHTSSLAPAVELAEESRFCGDDFGVSDHLTNSSRVPALDHQPSNVAVTLASSHPASTAKRANQSRKKTPPTRKETRDVNQATAGSPLWGHVPASRKESTWDWRMQTWHECFLVSGLEETSNFPTKVRLPSKFTVQQFYQLCCWPRICKAIAFFFSHQLIWRGHPALVSPGVGVWVRLESGLTIAHKVLWGEGECEKTKKMDRGLNKGDEFEEYVNLHSSWRRWLPSGHDRMSQHSRCFESSTCKTINISIYIKLKNRLELTYVGTELWRHQAKSDW